MFFLNFFINLLSCWLHLVHLFVKFFIFWCSALSFRNLELTITTFFTFLLLLNFLLHLLHLFVMSSLCCIYCYIFALTCCNFMLHLQPHDLLFLYSLWSMLPDIRAP